jgi:hypothetical protein
MRDPSARYVYGDVPAAKGALAAAEAFAYGADAILRIDPADLKQTGEMLAFIASLPARDLPPTADIGVVDDGSPALAEVMNLLARRNLLFQVVRQPSDRFPLTIVLGSAAYPAAEAADPSAFAQKIRRELTDDRRSLRIFGSEVVLARLTADAGRARLHLINYGGREIEGLRVRLRGTYASGTAYVAGMGQSPLADRSAVDGYTEFSIPRLGLYAVIDLER